MYKMNYEISDESQLVQYKNVHIGAKIQCNDVAKVNAKNEMKIICCQISTKVSITSFHSSLIWL